MKLLFVGGTHDGYWREVELKIIKESNRRVRLPKIKDAKVGVGEPKESFVMDNEEYQCHKVGFPLSETDKKESHFIYIMAEVSLTAKRVFEKLINNYKA